MMEHRSWSGQIEALDLRVHGLIHGIEKLLDAKVQALDTRVVLHIEAVEKWIRGELLAEDRRVQDMEKNATRAIDKAHEAVERAEGIRSQALEKYKETANEMRQALNDQRSYSMPKTEIESRLSNMEKMINDLRTSRDQAGGKTLGFAPLVQIGMLIAAGIVSAIVALLVK
jgi:hypothetical protein